jgi:hypothetical protein
MADLGSVGLSVVVTLTLQSAYLVLVKFPRILGSEQMLVQNAIRSFTAGMEEASYANKATGEAFDACDAAFGYISSTPKSERAGLESILNDLGVVEGKLKGLANCKEPGASYVRTVAESIERTKVLLNSEGSELEKQIEASSISQANSYSTISATLRTNEARNVLADDIEQRASMVRTSLMEFYGASVLGYCGLLVISALSLRKVVQIGWLNDWVAVVLGVVVFLLCSWMLRRLKKVGDAAQVVIATSEKNVKNIRENLMEPDVKLKEQK